MFNDKDFIEFKNVSKNWRWLKLLIPFWMILGGIPFICFRPHSTIAIATIIIVALLMAITLTGFCIKCYILYVHEAMKQIKELNDLEKEVQDLQNEANNKSPDSK